MTAGANDVDVAIVGGGIAGLIAARILSDQGHRACVLEARPRIGGRIHTDTSHAAVPVERGAEVIHGNRVRVWHYLERYGLAARPNPTRGVRFVDEGRLRRPLWLATHRSAWRLGRAMSVLAKVTADDQSAAEFLRARKIDGIGWRLAEILANAACAPLEELGVVDAAAGVNSPQTRGGEFRPAGGHQALVDAVASGLDVRRQQPVTMVRWTADGVDIEALDRIRARAAIITLPLGVLQAGTVRFEPDLPAAKRTAVFQLRMHTAVKVTIRFSRPPAARGVRSVVGDDLVPAWWRSFADPPMWTAFVTGPRAPAVASDPGRAIERLCTLIGAVPDAVQDVIVTDWGAEPWTLGGYSSAPPGAYAARAALAAPTGPLAFAGEATSTTGESGTVSGAILTGERAAAEVGEMLRNR